MRYLLPLLFVPTLAHAHAGTHDQGLLATLRHALAEPDHALALMALLVVPVAVWAFARGRR